MESGEFGTPEFGNLLVLDSSLTSFGFRPGEFWIMTVEFWNLASLGFPSLGIWGVEFGNLGWCMFEYRVWESGPSSFGIANFSMWAGEFGNLEFGNMASLGSGGFPMLEYPVWESGSSSYGIEIPST